MHNGSSTAPHAAGTVRVVTRPTPARLGGSLALPVAHLPAFSSLGGASNGDVKRSSKTAIVLSGFSLLSSALFDPVRASAALDVNVNTKKKSLIPLLAWMCDLRKLENRALKLPERKTGAYSSLGKVRPVRGPGWWLRDVANCRDQLAGWLLAQDPIPSEFRSSSLFHSRVCKPVQYCLENPPRLAYRKRIGDSHAPGPRFHY